MHQEGTEPATSTDPDADEGDFLVGSMAACRSLGAVLETTYGPYGRAKLVVNHLGNGHVVVGGDSVLDELSVEHPTARLLRDHCRAVGDGVTFAAVLAAALIGEAETLVERGVSPATVVAGYEEALVEAERCLDRVAVPVAPNETERYAVARTAVNGQFVDAKLDHLCRVVLDATARLVETTGGVDVDDVYFEDDIRLAVDDSRVVEGTVVRENVPDGVPGKVEDATVLLLEEGLVPADELPERVPEDGLRFADHRASRDVAAARKERARELADWVVDPLGADAVVSVTTLDDRVRSRLVDAGAFVLEGIQSPEIERVRDAVGGRVLPPGVLPDVDPATDLGRAGEVTVTDFGAGAADAVVFGACEAPRTVAVIVNGGTASVTEQARDLLVQGIDALAALHDDPRVVPGAGAIEIEVAAHLRGIRAGGRERLAIEAFADAVEAPAAQLGANAGFSPLDVVPALRNAHADADDAGIDLATGEPSSSYERGVVEPVAAKRDALRAAVDAVTTILRVDAALPAESTDGGGDAEAGGD